jgi:hypothetical protein
MIALLFAQLETLLSHPLTQNGIQTFGAGLLLWALKKLIQIDRRLFVIETTLKIKDVTPDNEDKA